jgi:hypothetical protein
VRGVGVEAKCKGTIYTWIEFYFSTLELSRVLNSLGEYTQCASMMGINFQTELPQH